MRLINVKTFKLSEFFGDEIPPYAILSHRWGAEEVGFQMFSESLPNASQLNGYRKIRYCAEQTDRDKLEWCWVDTCCIDKRSSSELSEAINSMYQWYQNAVYCYAYLEDIEYKYPADADDDERPVLSHKRIRKSEWFSRGWTLQELIAPKHLLFYSREWEFMGSKCGIASLISRQCGIDERVLLGTIPVDRVAVAQRMRWASGRKTTRIEDMAYSLLGIFDVNMPLLYGEGRKAFTRLQEEIIKRSTDQSIFSWIDRSASRTTFRSLLARTPTDFQHCQNVECLPDPVGASYAVTNRGLHISLPLQPMEHDQFEYLAALNCRFVHSDKSLAIRLRRTAAGSNQFTRVDPYRLYQIDARQPVMDVYVPENLPLPLTACNRVAGLKLSIKTLTYKLEAIHDGQDFCRLDDDQTIRFKSHHVRSYSIVQLLFIDTWMLSRKRLVILVYNPQLVTVAIPAGILSTITEYIKANASTGVIVVPGEDYDISASPSTQPIHWVSDRLNPSFNFVNVGKELVGDELVITANVQVNFGATGEHDSVIGDDKRRRQGRKRDEALGRYSEENTTSKTSPIVGPAFSRSRLNTIWDEPQPRNGG